MYFVIERASGGYRAKAYGDNREQLMLSEVYTAKHNAKHVIDVLKRGAASAPVYDRTV